MLIHTIDAGRRSGWAIGPAGEVPNSGFLILRGPNDPRGKGLGNLIAYLNDSWRRRAPDLIVHEAPMSVGAWAKNAAKRGFTGGDAIESGFELAGIIVGMAARYGIQSEVLRRQTILKQVTGSARYESRAEGKAAVIRALKRYRMIPMSCGDDDVADAVALHFVASGLFAKNKSANFGIFENL